jgi:hypothetical protein
MRFHERIWRYLYVLAVILAVSSEAAAQTAVSRPPLLAEDEEIRLARSAAPPEISRDADVWVLRRGGFVKVRSGPNGVACMVSRDHPESLYPICYDPESARTILPITLREAELREKGQDEAAIDAEIKAAIERGELKLPTGSAMSWMLSADQVIYAGANGRRVGKWFPHIMIYMPGATRAKLGFAALPNGDYGIGDEGKPTAHLIVITASWSTGTGSN